MNLLRFITVTLFAKAVFGEVANAESSLKFGENCNRTLSR